MVSWIWATIAASSGFMFYLLIPFAGSLYPIQIRKQIGTFYGKLAARALGQFIFLRRVLSGYDVKEIDVDAEQKTMKVTLSSNTLRDDKEFTFKDPDNRILRLWNKPVAIAYEEVPAALDAELAEWGYWTREKVINEGIERGEKIDPYVPISDGLRLVDPIDAYELVTNSVGPENIKTAEEKTKQRFAKYGSDLGMAETISTIMGFIAGVGAVAGLQYIKQNLLEGSAGGGSPLPEGPTIPAGMVDATAGIAMDVAVMVI